MLRNLILATSAFFVITSIGFSNVSNAAHEKKNQSSSAKKIKPHAIHHPQVALNQPCHPPKMMHAVDLD